MANPFNNSYTPNTPNSMSSAQGSPNMIEQFKQFASTIQGDPKTMVMNLLNSGQMSQEQFQQFSSMARMFQRNLR